MQIWWNSMYREYRDTDGHAGGITEWDGCTYLSHIAASMRGMLVTSSHTRPVPSHLSTCARVHRALQWDMPCVVRMPSRARLFLLPPSPFLFALFLLFSFSPFFYTPFALARVASEESEWRLKRADQNLLEGKRPVPFSRGMTSDFALSFTDRDTYVAKICGRRVSTWVSGEFGSWKLIVKIIRSSIEINGVMYHLLSQHVPYLYSRDVSFFKFSCPFFPMINASSVTYFHQSVIKQ